ncbi:MAG: hypothetical protein ACKOFH_04865 [Chthoniobacterales bacterium]
MLEAHLERRPDCIAPLTAGAASAARTAMMAMATSSSIKENPERKSDEYRKGLIVIILEAKDIRNRFNFGISGLVAG